MALHTTELQIAVGEQGHFKKMKPKICVWSLLCTFHCFADNMAGVAPLNLFPTLQAPQNEVLILQSTYESGFCKTVAIAIVNRCTFFGVEIQPSRTTQFMNEVQCK